MLIEPGSEASLLDERSPREGALGRTTRLLIADLDNTLYNWVDYFAPAFRAMVHVLAGHLQTTEDELVDQFKQIYAEYQTTEYPFTVQLLPAVSRLSDAQQAALVQLALTVFGGSRRKRLRPYPGVRETLSWAKASGVAIAVVTSAPCHVVAPKLNQLGLLSLTSLVVAWDGFDVPADLITYDKMRNSPVRARVRTATLPRESFAPKKDAYRVAMYEMGADASSTAVVGDSLRTDIAPAMDLNLPAYWARYGLAFSPKNLATVERITPGGAAAVHQAYATEPLPTAAEMLHDFSQLRHLLRTPQPSLF